MSSASRNVTEHHVASGSTNPTTSCRVRRGRHLHRTRGRPRGLCCWGQPDCGRTASSTHSDGYRRARPCQDGCRDPCRPDNDDVRSACGSHPTRANDHSRHGDGDEVRHSRKLILAGVGGGSLLLFGGCGALIGSVSDVAPSPAVTETAASLPLPLVTRTAVAPQPVEVTVPATTSTAPPPPAVTMPAPTLFVDPPVVVAAVPAPLQRSSPPAASESFSAANPGSGGATDPRFPTCKAAIAAGYGPYENGVDPEFDWYRDADHDGRNCES